MGKVIGIDLGTTNSAMAVLEGDAPEIIVNSDGDRTTPSVVAWKKGERIVGKTALRQRVLNVQNTIYSAKRFIGRSYSELTDADKEGIAYTLTHDQQGRPIVKVDVDGDGQPEDMLAEQISGAVLSKLKADAEKFLGEEVTEAVITVPAYFNDTQRQATKDAGKIAGLDVKRIINEPTAAALSYGFGKGESSSKKIMVFDLGGGTLDVSILDVSKDFVEVLSTDGDNHLGGDLWDSEFCSAIEDQFQDEYGINLGENAQAHARVLEAARNAKHELSNASEANVNLPFIGVGKDGPVSMDYTYTRSDFEEITSDLLKRCAAPVTRAMNGAKRDNPNFSFADIDEVLLVGGSTRMPAVQEFVKRMTGKSPEMTVNPDEVVAMGAAVQGGVLNGECQDIVLADVNSMSLGIRSYRANDPRPHVTHMIDHNSKLPTQHTESFTTKEDNQRSVTIVLIQGEDDNPDSPDNKILGSCEMTGIPPMKAGEPQIEITLTYNTDGIVEVAATATNPYTGESTHMETKISGTTKLTDREVNMLAAAEESMRPRL